MTLYVSRVMANLPLKIGQCEIRNGQCVCDGNNKEAFDKYEICPEECISVDGSCTNCHEKESCNRTGDLVSECANSLATENLVDFVMNVGDGSCDTFLNTRLCKFDGGDCMI